MEDNRKQRTKLRKSLQLCISRKLKKIPPIHIPSSAIPASIAGRRLLSTCRFPRTPSLDIDQAAADDDGDNNSRGNGHAATLSDVDRFLFDNFRSLYIHDRDENVCLSSSPGTSTSLVQPTAETSSSSDSVTEDAGDIAGAGDGGGSNTAMVLFSVDPYTDFRRSMQDMIRIHHGQESQPLDWDFLEELLLYYLQLNDRSVHKYILKAFADLTAEEPTRIVQPLGKRAGLTGALGVGKVRDTWVQKLCSSAHVATCTRPYIVASFAQDVTECKM